MGQRAESVMLNKGTHILEDIIRIVKCGRTNVTTLRSVMCFENLQSSVACLEIKKSVRIHESLCTGWLVLELNFDFSSNIVGTSAACNYNTSPFHDYK
jgi:hypothetical protein